MSSQRIPFTVKLGHKAKIQVADALVNSGVTIQFGGLDFAAFVAETASMEVPTNPPTAEKSVRRACLAVHPAKLTNASPDVERLGKKISVFDGLSCHGTSVSTDLPYKSFVSSRYDSEASSSGSKLSRKQIRKRNARLRAQGLPVEQPTTEQDLELKATVPTRNKFSNLKWVKRNSTSAELKKSFWNQQPRRVPVPQKKKTDTLSARVHKGPESRQD